MSAQAGRKCAVKSSLTRNPSIITLDITGGPVEVYGQLQLVFNVFRAPV